MSKNYTPSHERLSVDYLESIFQKYYKGIKSIGGELPDNFDYTTLNKFSQMQYKL